MPVTSRRSHHRRLPPNAERLPSTTACGPSDATARLLAARLTHFGRRAGHAHGLSMALPLRRSRRPHSVDTVRRSGSPTGWRLLGRACGSAGRSRCVSLTLGHSTAWAPLCRVSSPAPPWLGPPSQPSRSWPSRGSMHRGRRLSALPARSLPPCSVRQQPPGGCPPGVGSPLAGLTAPLPPVRAGWPSPPRGGPKPRTRNPLAVCGASA